MSNELNRLKKGTATFNLVGRAKVSDFTFKLDVESGKEDSDWVYNQLNLGVDCGEYGIIYSDMMSGYGTDRNNILKVHGKKEDENGKEKDDFNTKFDVDWEDRFEEDVLDTIGDMCFVTVGLEKKDGKTIYKKFLSPYDAIKYIEEHLEDNTIVNVKGNLKYTVYNESTQVKKEINSIVLSKAEDKDFRATFTQALLLDKDAIGKPDKETNTVPIAARIVDYFSKEFNGKSLIHIVNGSKVNGLNLPITKIFDFQIGEDKDHAKKMLKVFKVKGKNITQLVIDGYFTKGDVSTTSVTEDDIPDDIKELIELGYVEKEQILGQIALKNGGKRPEKMVIKSPHIKFTGEDVKMPSVDKIIDLYEEDDVNISLILESIGSKESEETKEYESDKVNKNDMDKALDEDINSEDEEEEDWLSNL